jgi:glycogen operon protein
MLLMGDEVRRSQGGNNNTWCQNNPLGWMHWQPDDEDEAMRTFLRRLILLRRHLAGLLNPDPPLLDPQQRPSGTAAAGQPWREWHGVELFKPDWAQWSHCLAWSLNDGEHGPLIWCGMNAYYKAMHFDLPASRVGWLRVLDTALPPEEALPEHPERWLPNGAPLESRSLMLMVAAPLMEGVELGG